MVYSNLPPGVGPSDIPGNRPEDIAADRIWDEAWDMLPFGFEDVADALDTIRKTSDHTEFTSACWKIVNEIENPEKWIAAIHDAAVKMGEIENPPEPEYDSDRDYDYYDE